MTIFNNKSGEIIAIMNRIIYIFVFILKNLSIAVYLLAIVAAIRVTVKTKVNIAARDWEIALNKYKIPSVESEKIKILFSGDRK
jgi:hypothetical protein